MKQISLSLAARVALLYAGAACLWIGGSDVAMGWAVGEQVTYTTLSIAKGFIFVLVTSGLLYWYLRRRLRIELAARQAAEETVRRLTELQAIAEHSGEVLYKHDLDGHFTYVSPSYQTLLGYGPEDLNLQWQQVVTDNPINRNAFDLTEKAIRTGERQPPCLVEVRKKNGSTLLLEVDESPLKDQTGKVTAMVGAARDVTAREKAQEELRQSEERFRRLAKTISEVFWMADLELTQIHYVSPAYEQIWGRTCQSLYDNPKSWAESIHPDDRDRVLSELTHGRGEREVTIDYRITRPDGAVRWIRDRAFPARNEAGTVVGLLGLARDVTERRIASEALRESEQQLKGIYSSMNEGLALHEIVRDANGQAVDYRLLNVNPAFEAITGLRRDKAVGALASALYGTKQAPFLETFANVAASSRPACFEAFFEPLGKHLDISVFSPRKGQFATVFTDISKRKDAERQICLLNQVYALISHINEAIVRASDREALFREACRIAVEHAQFRLAWVGLVDPPTGEIRPVAWAGQDDGYVANLRTCAAPTTRGLGPTGTCVREGRLVICPDIACDPLTAPWREAALARGYRSLISVPLRLGGQVIGCFAVYASEPGYFTAIVTESLVEVAADLSFALDLFERNRQRELERQQLRLQHSALEAAANAIVITNRDGGIEWVNAAFSRLTGYSREEAIGANPRLLKSGAQDLPFYQRLWMTILAGEVWQGTMTNKRKDGTLYEEEMTITPVRSDAGEIRHFVAIKQDITERRKLEQQFLRAQRMQSVGLLAGGVAHDLNNVLAPVLMALPLLRDEMPPAERDRILETLEQGVRRGANIIQQVLTFARGIEVQRATVQVRHLIREVTKIAEETFPRDILVRANLFSNLWPVQGDPTQIHQVLLNLAVNARDAMPDGGELGFTARNVELIHPLQFLDFEIPPGRYVSVSVADTGTGIPPATLEHIFEPFFTTKPVGKGTGLGLSTVLGIVKSHGGLVQVQTHLGAGSTFTVYLPAAVSDVAAKQSSQAPVLPQGRGETILVVDDESGILLVAKSALEANGYRVVTAKDGTQAVARFAEHGDAIKAMLTDIMMPSMDGLALTRSVRQAAPALPVIVATGLLSGSSDGGRAVQLRELGVRHFLRKPFQAEELLNILQEALRST